ncbi:MAG: glycosyltransferase family 2 protein [Flavobacteriaceae bacterium]|nr:glycosyltransferase family 2 protein [Flavobacteriaceae bacterium]
MKKKLVSVVLSTYNGEKYIKTQLDSIIAQTYKNIEVIIVDDYSSDNTVSILKTYVSRYSNIYLHEATKNIGYIKNFERGVKLAKGDFISFADQDDYWLPLKTEKLIDAIGSSDVVYCDSELVDCNLNSLGKNMSTGHHFISSSNPINFAVKNCVSGHAMLFKKSLLNNKFNFPELIPHDWWITFLASSKNGVIYLNETLVKYRIHDNNIIAGEGHQKKDKSLKNLDRKQRIKCFHEALPNNIILKKISNSYKNNFLVNRIKRVVVFISYVNELFVISDRSKFKKLFYALSMFFKIR